ncbi:hypothetical protein ACLKA7_010530 [Drosophila subpalustris]
MPLVVGQAKVLAVNFHYAFGGTTRQSLDFDFDYDSRPDMDLRRQEQLQQLLSGSGFPCRNNRFVVVSSLGDLPLPQIPPQLNVTRHSSLFSPRNDDNAVASFLEEGRPFIWP